MTVSTVPAARTYLNTIITAACPSPVLVCYDDPGTYRADDIISIGEVNRTASPLAMVGGGGNHWLAERYTITVSIGCFRGGDTPTTVESAAWTLLANIESAVRTDPSLAGIVTQCVPGTSTGSGEIATEPLEQGGELPIGRSYFITLELDVYAAI